MNWDSKKLYQRTVGDFPVMSKSAAELLTRERDQDYPLLGRYKCGVFANALRQYNKREAERLIELLTTEEAISFGSEEVKRFREHVSYGLMLNAGRTDSKERLGKESYSRIGDALKACIGQGVQVRKTRRSVSLVQVRDRVRLATKIEGPTRMNTLETWSEVWLGNEKVLNYVHLLRAWNLDGEASWTLDHSLSVEQLEEQVITVVTQMHNQLDWSGDFGE